MRTLSLKVKSLVLSYKLMPAPSIVQTTHQTGVGQLLDTLTAPIGTVSLSEILTHPWLAI